MNYENMSWEIFYDAENNLLRVKVIGVHTPDASTRLRHDVFLAMIQHNCYRLLIDNRGIFEQTLSTMDWYSMPAHYKELGVPHSTRLAVIPPARFAADYHLYETVSKNSGYQIAVFSDENSALDWLKN